MRLIVNWPVEIVKLSPAVIPLAVSRLSLPRKAPPDDASQNETHEYVSVAQLRGSATSAGVEDPAAFERANYVATLHSWTGPEDRAPAIV